MTKFEIYAATRRCRQAAGDEKERLLRISWPPPATYYTWERLESMLMDAESILERLDTDE